MSEEVNLEPQVEAVPDYTTVEGLKQHPLFVRLKLKKQRWLLAYIELKGDRIAATRAVTACRTHNSLAVEASRCLADSAVRQLIRIHYGCEMEPLPANKKRFVGALTEKLSDPTLSTAEFERIARLAANIAGWETQRYKRIAAKAPIEEKPQTVDELVLQLEKERKKGEHK